MHREQARERTRDAMRRKAERGHVAGGEVYGYRNVRLDGHVEREIVPAEPKTIRRIFRLQLGCPAKRVVVRLGQAGWSCVRLFRILKSGQGGPINEGPPRGHAVGDVHGDQSGAVE